MGNRDINKMRIVDELGARNIHEQDGSLPKHEGVYWLKSRPVCSGLPAVNPKDSIPPRSESASRRLQWMLAKTMGSVDAFELRRGELERERVAIMSRTSVPLYQGTKYDHGGAPVTDDEVAQSYIRSCHPIYGIMSQCEFHFT